MQAWLQICLCKNARASHTPIPNDVVFHTWCSTRMHDSTQATPVIISRSGRLSRHLSLENILLQKNLTIAQKRMGSAWWFRVPNTRALHGVSSERLQSGNSSSKLLMTWEKWLTFTGMFVRLKKYACATPNFKILSDVRPVTIWRSLMIQDWIGMQKFNILTRCRWLHQKCTIPQTSRAFASGDVLIFKWTFVHPKIFACASLNYSDSFRRPFSDHLALIDRKIIGT